MTRIRKIVIPSYHWNARFRFPDRRAAFSKPSTQSGRDGRTFFMNFDQAAGVSGYTPAKLADAGFFDVGGGAVFMSLLGNPA